MFTYIIRVLPNERFEVSRLVLVVLRIILFIEFKGFSEFVGDLRVMRVKIWRGVRIAIRLFLVFYLLVIIIIIVWLRIISKGAIRIF